MILWMALACTPFRGVAVPLQVSDTGAEVPVISDAWPAQDSVFDVGEELRASARLSHPALSPEELLVQASLNGAPLEGWSLSSDGGWSWAGDVSQGPHILELQVSDPDGDEAQATMGWWGNASPVVELSAPEDDQVVGSTEEVAVLASLDDPDGDELSWEWSEGGNQLLGGTVDTSAGEVELDTSLGLLTEGIHDLVFEVSDGRLDLRVDVQIRVSTD